MDIKIPQYDFGKKIGIKKFKEAIDDAERLGFEHCTVSGGGEPLLEYKTTLELMKYLTKKGLTTRLITNGYFFNSLEGTIKMLSELKKAGLMEMLISSDYHPKYKLHQSFVPLKNIQNAYFTCKEIDLKLGISIATYPHLVALNLKRLNKYIDLKDFDFFKRDGNFILVEYIVRNYVSEKNIDFPKEKYISKRFRFYYQLIRNWFKGIHCFTPFIYSNGLVSYCCSVSI